MPTNLNRLSLGLYKTVSKQMHISDLQVWRVLIMIRCKGRPYHRSASWSIVTDKIAILLAGLEALQPRPAAMLKGEWEWHFQVFSFWSQSWHHNIALAPVLCPNASFTLPVSSFCAGIYLVYSNCHNVSSATRPLGGGWRALVFLEERDKMQCFSDAWTK